MSSPVVTVTHTIMDGAVVRWYRTVEAAAQHRAVVSASRHGVSIHTEYLHQVPDEWLAAAKAAQEELELAARRGRRADVSRQATHRNSVVLNGPLVPIERDEDGVSHG